MRRMASLFLFCLGLSLLAPVLPAAATEPAAMPALLRTAVTVDDEVIRLGDLFDGALASPELAIARAPAPGESVVLDVRWLAAVARAHAVAWQPASKFDQSVVVRSSQVVGTDAIRAALLGELVGRGATGDLDIQFDGQAPTMKLPVTVAPDIAVQQLNFDAQSGRFTATLTAAGDGAGVVRTVLSGRAFTLMEVPVPVRRLLPGEIVREEDIEWAQVHADRVTAAIAIDPSLIVGRAPRRPIRAGEPIRANDLQIAIMMKRGTMVTMVLETPQMLITTQGRVMEDGAEGDLVSVMNMSSNRVVKATVVDPTTVAVAAVSAPATN
jgi:flagella basal body P-ring formation protein FlgA